MKPENAALVEAKLNATGVRIVNALYADETMDTLMDAAREEGRQSAGVGANTSKLAEVVTALSLVRMSRGWQYMSAETREIIDRALLSPQAAPAEQKEG